MAAWCMGWLALLLGGLQSSISLSSPCPSAPPSCVLLLLLLSALMCCCCCCANCSCDSGSTSTEDAVEARLVLPAVFAPPEAMLSSPPCCCCCCSSPSANLTPEPADLAGFLVLRSQKVCISPLPLMFCTPRDSILAHGACDRMRSPC